jgi:hypothetical protein
MLLWTIAQEPIYLRRHVPGADFFERAARPIERPHFAPHSRSAHKLLVHGGPINLDMSALDAKAERSPSTHLTHSMLFDENHRERFALHRDKIMKLRPCHVLGPLCLTAILTDCVLVPNCPAPSCAESFDLVEWCTSTNTCKINDQFCAKCTFSRFLPDNTLEVPFDLIRPSLGSRNDLFIKWERDFMGESNFEASFDGVLATEEQCKREPYAQYFVFSCSNLPESMKRLTIKYLPPASNKDFVSAEVGVSDKECYDTYECRN